MRIKQLVVVLLVVLATTLPARADQEMNYRNQIAAALNAKDYDTLRTLGEEWIAEQEKGTVPSMGPTHAQICLALGYGLYQGFDKQAVALSAEEYKKLVVEPLEKYLEVDQSDFVRIAQILGNATKTLFTMEEPKSQDSENLAVWSMWRAVVENHKMEGFARPISKKTANLVYQYIEFCKGMVESTEYPDLYRYRIRNACQLGFGADIEFDRYFWQWYDVTFFDEGNIRAGVLYQKGLDDGAAAGDTEEEITAVVATFQRCIDATKTNKYKAMAYQQLAEFLNFYPDPKWSEMAMQNAQAAYRLNPYERSIRDLYGSLLFKVANTAVNEKNFGKALQLSQEGTSFVHQKDYECYMILARAQQYHGMKLDAIKNARTAYMKACSRAPKTDLDQYFTPVYKEILKQFGQEDKFTPCPGRN